MNFQNCPIAFKSFLKCYSLLVEIAGKLCKTPRNQVDHLEKKCFLCHFRVKKCFCVTLSKNVFFISFLRKKMSRSSPIKHFFFISLSKSTCKAGSGNGGPYIRRFFAKLDQRVLGFGAGSGGLCRSTW